MAQLPGKKFRVESTEVDGVYIPWDVRIDASGTFYAYVGEDQMKAKTLEALREMVRPVLVARHKLEFAPYIHVEYIAGGRTSRWDNRGGSRQEVRLEFAVVWVSTTKIETVHKWRGKETCPMQINGHVSAGALRPLDDADRRDNASVRHSDMEDLVPFTPERWAKLCALQEAIATTRERLAAILSDTTGAQLDAVAGQALLPPLPEVPNPALRTKK